MAHKIAEIKGMSAAAEAKLVEAQITTIEQLLAQAGTAKDRAALAKQLEVSSSELTEWVNRADLMRLKGVGSEMANLLEECGVDSCKELQHRVAANLYTKLKATNDEKQITHHAPTLAQIQEWIAESATLAAS
jgi:predicted flap endonuclease-1-like 5' DNA nuclease